ncbi:MAG: hypothetical protein II433_10030 [Acidaminococcaceae bacterium]|nr:hypothetical protein [Acidaminococcaceae bacterium]
MSDAVIVGLLALLGTIFTAVWQNKKLGDDFQKRSELADVEMDKKISVYAAKTDEKLDALTKSVNEHNQFARRVPVLEEQMKVANHRIDDLERKA